LRVALRRCAQCMQRATMRGEYAEEFTQAIREHLQTAL